MRITLLALLIAGCGDEGNSLDMTVVDLSMPDLTPGPDQAMQPTTVSCGPSMCDQNNGQVCCVTGAPGSFMSNCSTAAQCTTNMGNAFTCDGPEDCPTATNGCCVTVSGTYGNKDAGTTTMGSGGGSCMSMCPAMATYDLASGAFTAHSKLCHYRADCVGYMGNAVGTSTAFDLCCSNPMFGNYAFCFPSMYMNFIMGLSCN